MHGCSNWSKARAIRLMAQQLSTSKPVSYASVRCITCGESELNHPGGSKYVVRGGSKKVVFDT